MQQQWKRRQIQIEEALNLREQKVHLTSFEVISKLGKGSFGVVWLVKMKKTKDLYALKILEKTQVLKQNMIKYAVAERNILTTIQHPFIVSMHHAFQTPERLYLMMDYCPGGDLGIMLAKGGKIPEDLARIYCAEILLALQYLHEQGIVYRDLKPDNIVLDPTGHCRLTDFGLSKEGMAETDLS